MPVENKPLFRPDAIRPHLRSFSLSDGEISNRETLIKWAELLESRGGTKFKEQELLPDFVTDVFCNLLGYTRPADSPSRYTRAREKYIQVDGKFADAVLGEFGESLAADRPIVVVEGKGPKDPLERPFAGRKKSAVEQGYGYAINLECDWIIVTSMSETRLYHKGSDQQTYERFDISDLAYNDSSFRKFVFLLSAERVVPQSGKSHLFALKEASEKVGKTLTKSFYLQYAELREDIFETLCSVNPNESRHRILSATQKVLDRVLFTAFCEDRGLLPDESLKQAFEHSDPYNKRPIWTNFKGLFRSIDAGNPDLNIPPYNGGLFADDDFLERLTVPDSVCEYFRELGAYEYRASSEVSLEDSDEDWEGLIDVEILGHIFEQSITDLELLRNELDGVTEPVGKEKHKSRRKKEGAFYTPEFITRYILEQTLGPVLKDRFEALRIRLEASASGTAKKSLADPNVYDLKKLNSPQKKALVGFWENWQEELRTVRILDPACGSGAFLIEAFDQLHNAYVESNDRLEELRGERSLFDLDRRILQENLFGVDLNDEAIQICRLSLWIKTAERGKQLTSLDESIRVGNSVVSDTEVHERAFDWKQTFSKVFSDGGFDVVVGNPPYIRQEWLAPYKPHWEEEYASYHGTADIFVYFYELGVELLREGGRLGFITSGSWVRSNFGAPLRGHLSANVRLESFVDFGEFQPFDGAEMIRPSIAVLRSDKPKGTMRLFKWLTNGVPPTNLSDVIASSSEMDTGHLSSGSWELESDDVRALRNKLFESGIPLGKYADGKLLRGVVTGANDVFVIDEETRDALVAQHDSSKEIIKPLLQGSQIRPWHASTTKQYLIFARRGIDIDAYPAISEYLEKHRERLEPRPKDWKGGKWPGRKPGPYKWYEIQDAIDYWRDFDKAKILWPDIAKLPRFTMDLHGHYLTNTGYVIPLEDYFLLGILASWSTWFSISKTAQPLRLRGGRWQYRLFGQYMENIPIPHAEDDERDAISTIAQSANELGIKLFEKQDSVRRRLTATFGEGDDGTVVGKLNKKAIEWWELSLKQLGLAVKTSFKLERNPFESPQVADDWESYISERASKINEATAQLEKLESELNDRVFKLFKLSQVEIDLLLKEVEH